MIKLHASFIHSIQPVLLNLLAVIFPLLAGFVLYDQLRTPIFDAGVDPASGVIISIDQNSTVNWAGLRVGDVILRIDGSPYPQWPAKVGVYPVEIRRISQILTLNVPLVSKASVNLANLFNAFLVAATFWVVGVYLLWRRSGQHAIHIFFLLTQSIGIGLLLFLAYPIPEEQSVWIRVVISLGFHLAAALIVHLYTTFPLVLGNRRQRLLFLSGLYCLMLAALALRLTGSSIGIRISFFINTLELLCAMLLLVFVYRYRASVLDRRKLRIILVGSLISLLPSFILYLLPTIVGMARVPNWMIGPFMVIIPISYLIAIVYYNLFGIDRFLNRAMVYVLLSAGILLLYLGPFLFIVHYAPGDWLAQLMVTAGLTLLVGITFERIKLFFQRVIDRLFYGGWYDYPAVIEQVTRALSGCTTREQFSEILTYQVPELMQLQSSRVIFDQKDPSLPVNCAANFILSFQGDPRAVWIIQPHRDRDELTDSDRRILHTLAVQAEIALGNVLLIETLRMQLHEIRASREALALAQQKLIRSREEERARLSRDLHDGPLQVLVGMNLQAGMLLMKMENLQPLVDIRQEIRDLISELRGVCAELRPPMLDILGFPATLRSLAEDWSSQQGVVVDLQLPEDTHSFDELPGELSVNLYRVAQEALSNIARHAGAARVGIQLEGGAGKVVLSIRDDGNGFTLPEDINSLAMNGHFGLVGLRERVNLIGGALQIQSEPGSGTSLQVVWTDGK